MGPELEQDVEALLDRLGFELVRLERGGGRRRPLLRLRIARPGDDPGRSTVTVDDCARVTGAIREQLVAREEGGDWILEVSSPGIERPLGRPSDYQRFAGRRVRVHGYGPLVEGRRRLEGTLLGLSGPEEARDRLVRLEADFGQVEFPLSAVARAELVYSGEPGEASGAR